jgi:hypothetical protein
MDAGPAVFKTVCGGIHSRSPKFIFVRQRPRFETDDSQ